MVEGSIVVVEEAEAAGKENYSYYYDITAIAYSSRPQRTFDLEVFLQILFDIYSFRICLFDTEFEVY